MASLYHPRYPNGTISPAWNLRCWLKGQRKHHYIRLTYPDGRRVSNQRDAWKLLTVHEATCQATAHAGPLTVTRAWTAYLEETVHLRGPKEQTELTQRARRLTPSLGTLLLQQVTRDQIEQALNQLVAEGYTRTYGRRIVRQPISLVTRDHYLDFLKAFCRWCVVVKEWLPRNPTEAIPRIGKSPSRPFVPEEEWTSFLADVQQQAPQFYPGTAFTLMTGLRRSETTRLLKSDFFLTRRTYRIRSEVAKNDEEAMRPLMDELVPILTPLLATLQPQDQVFPYPMRRWQETIGGILRQRGYQGWGLGIHTLRHSFSTWAYGEHQEYKGMWLTRHKSLEMARRYTHLSRMPVTPMQMTRQTGILNGDTRKDSASLRLR